MRSAGLPAPRTRLAGSAGQPRAFGRGQTIGRRASGDRSHRRLAAYKERAPARRRRTSGVEPGFARQAAYVAAAKPGAPPGDRARAPAGPPTGAAPCPAAPRSGSVRHRPALQPVSAADAVPAIETEGRNPTRGFGGEHREPESATASDQRAGRLPNVAWCNTCKISDTSAVHGNFAAAFGQFWWKAEWPLTGRRVEIRTFPVLLASSLGRSVSELCCTGPTEHPLSFPQYLDQRQNRTEHSICARAPALVVLR